MAFDLTLTNAAFVADGVWGQALSGGYGVAAGQVIPSDGLFKVAARVKTTTPTGNIKIIAGAKGAFWIGANTSGQLQISYGNGANTSNAIASVAIANNNWHYVLIDFSSTGIKVYFDGVFINVDNATTGRTFLQAGGIVNPADAASAPLAVADYGGFLGQFTWIGQISEVAIFDETKTTPDTFVPTAPVSSTATGLLALWKLDGDGVDSAGVASNALPSVSITSPANGATFISGQQIPIQATATDSDGVINKVEFYQDGVLLGTDSSTGDSSYTYTITSATLGAHNLVAKAYDNDGGIVDSTAIPITVNAPSSLLGDLILTNPTYNTSGKFGQSLNGGYGIIPTKDVIPDNGIFTIECFVKTTVTGVTKVAMGQANVCFLGINASGIAIGSYGSSSGGEELLESDVVINNGSWHHLRLVCDNSGGKLFVNGKLKDSSTTTFLASNAVTTPTDSFGVKDFGGHEGTTFVWQGEIDEVAIWNVARSQGNFNVYKTPLASNTGGLLALYHLDGNGTDAATIAQESVVPETNTAPTISITSPVSGGVYTFGASIPITVNALDGDGVISKVEFFNGATKLGESTVGPYDFTLSGASEGSYSVTAKATDDLGATTTSSAITFSVSAPAAGVPNIAYNNNAIYYSPGSFADTGSSMSCVNTGSYQKTNFKNLTSLSIAFDTTGLVAPFPQIWVEVDGGPKLQYTVANNIAIPLPSDKAAWKKTTLRTIVKSTNFQANRWGGVEASVRFKGFVTNPEATVVIPKLFSKKAIWFGDSVSEGNHNVNQTDANICNQSDAMLGYAFQIMDRNNFEFCMAAFGGQGETTGGGLGVPLMSTYNMVYSGQARDIAAIGYDFAFNHHGINNGSNDSTTVRRNWINAMMSLLPNAKIVNILPVGNGYAATSKPFVQNAIATSNDPSRPILIDTTGMYDTTDSADGTHPYGSENLTGIMPQLDTALKNQVFYTLVEEEPTDPGTVTLPANKPSVYVATKTATFASLGFNSTNIRSIILVDVPLLSWIPGRTRNDITGFELGKSYYINTKAQVTI